jgi:hypothetical protein
MIRGLMIGVLVLWAGGASAEALRWETANKAEKALVREELSIEPGARDRGRSVNDETGVTHSLRAWRGFRASAFIIDTGGGSTPLTQKNITISST